MGIENQATDPTRMAVAAEAIPKNQFVCARAADGSGKVRQCTNSEADVAGLRGWLRKAVAAEKSCLLNVEGDVADGFSGLTPGQEYFLDVAEVDTYGNLSAGQWTRSVGVARTATKMDLRWGPVIQVSAF